MSVSRNADELNKHDGPLYIWIVVGINGEDDTKISKIEPVNRHLVHIFLPSLVRSQITYTKNTYYTFSMKFEAVNGQSIGGSVVSFIRKTNHYQHTDFKPAFLGASAKYDDFEKYHRRFD